MLCDYCGAMRDETGSPCPSCLRKWHEMVREGNLPPGLEGYTEEDFTFEDYKSLMMMFNFYKYPYLLGIYEISEEDNKKQLFESLNAIVKRVQERKANGGKVSPKVTPKTRTEAELQKDLYDEFRTYQSKR